MNKITKVFVFCFFSFSLSMIAQTESTLENLLEKLQENHMGSISDVFTLEEQQILRNYFDNQSINTETQEGGGSVFLYGPNNSKGTFGSFDVMDPSIFSPISNSPLTEFEGAGAFDYSNLDFKLIDNVGGLFKLSLSGTYTSIGSLTPPAGESFTGLEYDSSTGILYGLSTDGDGSSTLSTIDPVGGTVTPIGNTGIMLPINLAIDDASIGYTIGIDGNFSFRIMLDTAEAEPIGDVGFDANFGQGMAYDLNNFKIYLSAFNNDTFQTELRTLDTNTGMTTFIGAIGNTIPGGLIQIGWTGSPDNQLSIGDISLYEFSFFPNPARGVLTVKANEAIETVEIYNLLGQQVISQKIGALSSNINVSHLTSGNYILHVRIDNQFETYKLIKQ